MSCISELNEYFFKIRKDLKKSMSKLSFEPNNIKNINLAQKLQPNQIRFSYRDNPYDFSKIITMNPWCEVE